MAFQVKGVGMPVSHMYGYITPGNTNTPGPFIDLQRQHMQRMSVVNSRHKKRKSSGR